jgi:histidyl-tRNA synthetase
MDINRHTAEIRERVVSDIKDTLKNTNYTHITFAFSQKLSIFSKDILAELNINDKKSLLTIKRATKDSVVMSVPGPISILKSVIDQNIPYQDEPIKLFDYGLSLVDEDNDIQTEPIQQSVFKIECIGDIAPVRDAELILTAYRLLEELKIPNLMISINELGGISSRELYYTELLAKISPRYKDICELYQYNPIELYNQISHLDLDIDLQLPQIVDYLDATESKRFKSILEFLDSLDIPYIFTPTLSGGLGFNEGTYFEIISQGDPDIVLARGGRHNNLFELLGGDKDFGSVGMEIYINPIVDIIEKYNLFEMKPIQNPDIFVASIGPEGQKSALKILSLIQKNGLGVKENFGIKSLRQQLMKAKKSDATITLIVGRKEAVDGTVILRDKHSENQEVVPIEKLLHILSQKLQK